MAEDLFSVAAEGVLSKVAPLAARMRPRSLDEVVGQDHLLGPGSPMRQLVEGGAATSVLLWGPPGTGKTTLARLLATGRRFVELSAVTAGVKDVRAAIEEAKERLALGGERSVLFVDEVHRFTKSQQDALLPGVESGLVTFVGATTENPFFSVISPLLSRSLLLTLRALDDAAVAEVVARALADERGLGGTLTIADDALDHLVTMAAGDGRRALTALEAGAAATQAGGGTTIELATLEQALDRAAVRYDREGDQHYDVISAFIKSIRGSDVDAGLHYLARMIEAGEDPRFIARRLVILASEDVGLAQPDALGVAVAAAHALELVGLPEAKLNLAQAVIYLALAPKSNAVTTAIGAASEDVRSGKAGPVPAALRDAHYAGAKRLQHGSGYRYPHDFPGGVVRQNHLPEELADREYYRPSDNGAERAATARLAVLRESVRGRGSDGDPSRPDES
ncbi:MAG TPA: replication-associated recombination protein A [Mycobacteriales bacterium]|nr:replication-associated recombination protein A [Mycobacteriales bacterium]